MSFKNPNGGGWYTQGLFIETVRQEEKTGVKYTLKDREHRGYPSLYQLYLALEDLTEYEFANTYLGGWDHWQALLACTWFQEYINRWRTELELKLKCEAIKRIRMEAESGGKSSYQANRWIVDRGWIDKHAEPKRGRGRPSKNEIRERALQEAQDDYSQLQDDMKRLGLN